MASHKFRVGQVVKFSSPRIGPAAGGVEYKVLRLLACQGHECTYRIKNIREAVDRVAKESELTLGMSADQPGIAGNVMTLVPPPNDRPFAS